MVKLIHMKSTRKAEHSQRNNGYRNWFVCNILYIFFYFYFLSPQPKNKIKSSSAWFSFESENEIFHKAQADMKWNGRQQIRCIFETREITAHKRKGETSTPMRHSSSSGRWQVPVHLASNWSVFQACSVKALILWIFHSGFKRL